MEFTYTCIAVWGRGGEFIYMYIYIEIESYIDRYR